MSDNELTKEMLEKYKKMLSELTPEQLEFLGKEAIKKLIPSLTVSQEEPGLFADFSEDFHEFTPDFTEQVPGPDPEDTLTFKIKIKQLQKFVDELKKGG